MNERDDFHPLVGLWLAEKGYTSEHEYIMPDYGIADFFAKDAQGNTYVVECKPFNPPIGISEVNFYRAQIPGSRAIVATLTEFTKPRHFELAQKYDIELIAFDAPPENGYRIIKVGASWLSELEYIERLKKRHPEQFTTTQVTQVVQEVQIALPANGLAARIAKLPDEYQLLIEQALLACEGKSIIPLNSPQEYYTKNGTG